MSPQNSLYLNTSLDREALLRLFFTGLGISDIQLRETPMYLDGVAEGLGVRAETSSAKIREMTERDFGIQHTIGLYTTDYENPTETRIVPASLTLIKQVEGNALLAWNNVIVIFKRVDGELVLNHGELYTWDEDDLAKIDMPYRLEDIQVS